MSPISKCDITGHAKIPWQSLCCLVKTDLPVAATLTILSNPELKQNIIDGYVMDSWCQKLISAVPGMSTVQL